MNMGKKIVLISKFSKNIFFRLNRENVLFLTKGPIVRPISYQSFCRPTSYFVGSKTTTAQQLESSLFPPKFRFFIGSFASDIANGSDLSNSLLVQYHAKRFTKKGSTFCQKTQHSYFLLKFMHIVLSFSSEIAKGSNWFQSVLVQCNAKRFIQKRFYILLKDLL